MKLSNSKLTDNPAAFTSQTFSQRWCTYRAACKFRMSPTIIYCCIHLLWLDCEVCACSHVIPLLHSKNCWKRRAHWLSNVVSSEFLRMIIIMCHAHQALLPHTYWINIETGCMSINVRIMNKRTLVTCLHRKPPLVPPNELFINQSEKLYTDKYNPTTINNK